MTRFDPTNRDTWGDVLTLPEVAAILREGPAGVEKRCSTRTYQPAPHWRRPLRWRKSDVVRHIDGERSGLRRTA